MFDTYRRCHLFCRFLCNIPNLEERKMTDLMMGLRVALSQCHLKVRMSKIMFIFLATAASLPGFHLSFYAMVSAPLKLEASGVLDCSLTLSPHLHISLFHLSTECGQIQYQRLKNLRYKPHFSVNQLSIRNHTFSGSRN